MTAPNRNTLWARALVDELAAAGVSAACVTPGSRSTPLTAAFARDDDVHVFSHLDERSSAYFALGRARRTGEVTPLVCTSGTAAANYHPAVLEADRGRVPLLVLTADRPPELRDSGANQTVDQEKLYGDAVRWYRDLPEPEAEDRKLRSLRVTAARALSEATGTPAGPVHLNVPFRKPLEPTPVEGDVPDDLDPVAERGRGSGEPAGAVSATGAGNRPYVRTARGAPELGERDLRRVAEEISVDRGLIVAGPTDPPGVDADAVAALAHATGFPIVADPLSGLRFGGHVRTTTVLGGYDAYLDPAVTDDWPDPEAVFRLGASPTSKSLRTYLARTDARQFLVDPAGEWREAEFAASDLLAADPSRLAWRLSQVVRGGGSAGRASGGAASASGGSGDAGAGWRERFETAERTHWDVLDDAGEFCEGRLLADVAELAPEPSTLVVSNSMPVRDLDRFARPSDAARTVLGNRGTSGIDGVVSTALGAGSATTDRLTLVIGDLAYYHDANGLLAVGRCDVDATIVLVNNDGGGIFHMLPIESFDPPFTAQFKTPHGLDFEPTADLYDLEFARIEAGDRGAFRETYAESVDRPGTQVIEVRTDAEESHRVRERLRERVIEELTDD
jgi:2-succinyl-5-enolpyruvyl-6-hydroxy-3-cyclohexene-1-carboxylate synthase